MTDRSKTIRDAAFVAAMWGIETPEVRQIAEEDRLSALDGFMAAIALDDDRIWPLVICLDLYSIDELKGAGVPEFVIERRQMQLAPTEEQLRAQQAAQEQIAKRRAKLDARRERREQEQAGSEPPPTLSEMLTRERTENIDVNIAHNARYFARQVSELSDSEAEELSRRLDDWWPDKPYAQTVTRNSENSWSQENFAAAWMWLAPPLDKDLTARQWAELACSGILFHDQTEWLKRKATTDSKLELARICQFEDTRVWHQALQATPDPLPAELIKAAVASLKTLTEPAYGLDYIGQRLYQAAGPAPLRALSAVSAGFADDLRHLLASDGDEDAQAVLVRELREELRTGERSPNRSLRWVDAIDSDGLLDDLLACLSLAYGSAVLADDDESWYPSDVLSAVMSAIRNIGGRKAVAGYDELLQDPKNAFLRAQRDAIAQAMLQADGLEAAQAAVLELGLPFFAEYDR